MLAYLSRYTHRKTMTLATDEFIRRFLVHILPHGFHRIRHYGMFANGNRAANIACAPICSPCHLAQNNQRYPRPQQKPTSRAWCRVHVLAAAAG